MVRNANASLVVVETDGVSAPLSTVPQCRTCGSNYRDQVERYLGEGRAYMAIAALLPPDADLTPRNLRDHFANGHVDIDAPAVRRASQQQGQALEAAREPLVAAQAGYLTFAHAVLARVAERLHSGDLEPEIRDGLAAAKLIAAMETAARERNQIGDYVTAMVALIDVVRETVPAQTFVESAGRSAGTRFFESCLTGRVE